VPWDNKIGIPSCSMEDPLILLRPLLHYSIVGAYIAWGGNPILCIWEQWRMPGLLYGVGVQ